MARDRVAAYLGPQKEILSPSLLDKYEATGNWLLDCKVDGCHGILDTDPRGCVASLISRTGQRFGEAGELMGRSTGLADTTLVGEFEVKTQHSIDIVKRRGFRCFWVFDVVRLHGQDLRHAGLEDRRMLLEQAVRLVSNLSEFLAERIILVPQVESGFSVAYRKWKADGGEGAVAKRRGSKYTRQTSDGRTTDWRRFKDVLTVDLAVVGTGRTPSGAVNLTVGAWRKGKMVEVQSLAVPKGYTAEKLMGRVIECEYDVQTSDGKYRHLRFVRVRDDKSPKDTG
jgi:ATP-dependent DNA ligase